MRKGGKFAEALALYQSVAKDFPDTDYAPRAGLAIGYCHVGMERPLAAVEQWKQFVTASPAGPWRGQAYIGLIDLNLEQTLDAGEAVKCADMAAAALDKALANEKSAASWKLAIYDLYLRHGVIAFLQRRNEAAADSFDRARGQLGGRDKETSRQARIAD